MAQDGNLEDVPMGQLPEHLELQRTRVVCNPDAPIYTDPVHYSGAYMASGVDNSLTFEEFRKNLRVQVTRLTEDDIEFEIAGIDASLANAFRRILIAEVWLLDRLAGMIQFLGFSLELWAVRELVALVLQVPTMAIEKVFIANNTSVIQDEVLAHRLGLIPIKADPRQFDFKEDEEVASEKNTIVFKLDVKCSRQGERVKNASVKSDQLKWLPRGSEMPFDTNTKYTSFSCSQDSLPAFMHDGIAPRYKDIIVAKLGHLQEIELEAHAVKGIGKTHAKWSPVATARYKMLPEVILKEEFTGNMAEQLVQKCPVNVFDLEDFGGGSQRATVARPKDCTLCRECVRDDGWEKKIQLRRVRDHFIFTIESTGALPPEVIFTEAVKILVEKCQRVYADLS